jgi:hypothetical protein
VFFCVLSFCFCHDAMKEMLFFRFAVEETEVPKKFYSLFKATVSNPWSQEFPALIYTVPHPGPFSQRITRVGSLYTYMRPSVCIFNSTFLHQDFYTLNKLICKLFLQIISPITESSLYRALQKHTKILPGGLIKWKGGREIIGNYRMFTHKQ